MPKVIIPSGSGEILFVTDQSASLNFRSNSDFRTGSGVIGKWEIDDPLLALTKMARRDLGMEDMVIKTGEELPSVIRKLLGEENNLRASVMQTASSVVEQSATKRSLDTISKLGTEGGWLFNTAEEALSRGKILNAQRIEGNPGTGLLVSDNIGKYTTPELAKQFSNVNLFDSWLKSKIYQNLSQ